MPSSIDRVRCTLVGDEFDRGKGRMAVGEDLNFSGKQKLIHYCMPGYDFNPGVPRTQYRTLKCTFEDESGKLQEANADVVLQETNGRVDYDRLRPLIYPPSLTDVFVLLYSVVEPATFENVKNKFFPEVLAHNPDRRPVLLVGVNTENRIGEVGAVHPAVSSSDGRNLAVDIEATFLECNLISGEGVIEMFQEAVVAVLIDRGIKRTSRADGLLELCCRFCCSYFCKECSPKQISDGQQQQQQQQKQRRQQQQLKTTVEANHTSPTDCV
jgi:hypothetical protein